MPTVGRSCSTDALANHRSTAAFVHLDERKATWKSGLLLAESCLRLLEAVDIHTTLWISALPFPLSCPPSLPLALVPLPLPCLCLFFPCSFSFTHALLFLEFTWTYFCPEQQFSTLNPQAWVRPLSDHLLIVCSLVSLHLRSLKLCEMKKIILLPVRAQMCGQMW